MGRYWGPTKCPDEPQLQDSFFLTQDLGSHCVTQAGSHSWSSCLSLLSGSATDVPYPEVFEIISAYSKSSILFTLLTEHNCLCLSCSPINQKSERCCLSVPLNESHSYHQRTDTSSPRSHQLPGAPWSEAQPGEAQPYPSWNLTALTLYRSCIFSHSYCEFKFTMGLPWPGKVIFTAVLYNFSS